MAKGKLDQPEADRPVFWQLRGRFLVVRKIVWNAWISPTGNVFAG